ncbi:MAG: haloacid dehalogenase type II [Psychromonas sp.]
MAMQRNTILFDINETVLNLEPLNKKFKLAFGHQAFASTWFSMLLHSSTVCIVTGVKTNFAILASDMLDSLAARSNVVLTDAVRDEILTSFANLPPHADIIPALKHLQSAGYRTIAFSNSSLKLITNQINNAGLSDYFDEIVSVEEVVSFKPDPKVYRFVANKLGQPIEALRLVATHDWDTHGALSVGMNAAYIARSTASYNPQYKRPDVIASCMEEIVDKIIMLDTKQTL